jgi:short/branched chain acyl-CoA dehydrogenase
MIDNRLGEAYITNAGTDISGVITVTATTGTRDNGDNGDKELSAIIVPSGTPGLTVAAPYTPAG